MKKLLLIIALLCLFLSACGKKDEIMDLDGMEVLLAEEENLVWNDEHIALDRDFGKVGRAGGSIEMIAGSEESGSAECIFLREGRSDRVQVTLGVMQAFQELEAAVTRFNCTYTGMRIEIVSYYDEENGFEADLEKLNLDIVSGKAPDLLETSMLDYEIL